MKSVLNFLFSGARGLPEHFESNHVIWMRIVVSFFDQSVRVFGCRVLASFLSKPRAEFRISSLLRASNIFGAKIQIVASFRYFFKFFVLIEIRWIAIGRSSCSYFYFLKFAFLLKNQLVVDCWLLLCLWTPLFEFLCQNYIMAFFWFTFLP